MKTQQKPDAEMISNIIGCKTWTVKVKNLHTIHNSRCNC